jgi:hypothetical protein
MTRHTSLIVSLASAVMVLLVGEAVLRAHSGPPYPIVSNHVAGAYDISIWTDPDTTDDGSAQGKFWVVLAPAAHTSTIPAGTTVRLTIQATDRTAAPLSRAGEPTDGQISRQFAALVMDHEGPFSVHTVIDGPLGHAEVDGQVDATYDARPSRLALVMAALPFVAIGVLWFKVMIRRRRVDRPASD